MKIIIAGAGAVGTHLAKLLSREHQECTLMDAEPSRLVGLDSDYDIMTMLGSPTSIKALEDAGTADADLFVAVTPDESRNMNACILAHAIGAKKTVARIDNYEYLDTKLKPFFRKLGIDSLIYPEAPESNRDIRTRCHYACHIRSRTGSSVPIGEGCCRAPRY